MLCSFKLIYHHQARFQHMEMPQRQTALHYTCMQGMSKRALHDQCAMPPYTNA